MQKYGKKRILPGKMGLDAHDNGIVIVAKWLSDAGIEVIYAGLYHFPETLVQTAIQEGLNAIQEAAFTLALAQTTSGGSLHVDLKWMRLPRGLAFLVKCISIFFEEIAKLRAMRRIWARIMKEKFVARNRRACGFEQPARPQRCFPLPKSR
jgi:hypothetical protein